MEMRGARVAFEGMESRLLLAYAPVDTTDAIYDLILDGVNTAARPIRVSSFSIGLGRSIADSTGSAADREATAPTGQEMALSMPSSGFSPALMQLAFKGQAVPHATLIARSPTNPSVEYERWTLDEAAVTSYQTGGATGGGTGQDAITLKYARVAFQVTPRDTAGVAQPPVATSYDFKIGKAGDVNAPPYGGQFFDPPVEHVLEVGGGQIPISSFSWGVVQKPTTGGTGGAGGTTGSVDVAQFSFTATGGIHSPALFADTAHGEGVDYILTSRDSTGRIYSRWVLQDGMLSSYSTGDSGGDPAPRQDAFTLDVVKMERAYYEYDPKGKVTTTQSGYDVAAAESFTTGSLDLSTGYGAFDPVSPDPRRTPLNTLTLRFPQKLAGNPLSAGVALFRDGQRLSVAGLAASTADGGLTWQITGLAPLTAQAGRYTFNLFAANASLEFVPTDGGPAPDFVQGDSVSWVMDTTLPTITASSAQLEAGAQLVVRVTFSDAVTGLAAGDLSLTSATTPGLSYTTTNSTWDAATRTARFRFNAAALPDGNYTAVMQANAVTDTAGNPLAAGLSLPTFLLNGDANRDRTVNFTDLLTLAKNYNATGKTWSDGDFTGDGVVNFSDLLILAKAYNTAVPAPAEVTLAMPALAPVTSTSVVRDDRSSKPVFSTRPVAKPAPAPAKPKPAARSKGR